MLCIVAFIIHTWRPHATIQEQDLEGYFFHLDPLTLDCRWEFHNKVVVQKATYCQIEKYMKEKKERETHTHTDPEEERIKNRELSLMSFLVSFCDLVLLSFCRNCCVQECFRVSIFIFYDGLLTLACQENPEIVVLKLHFLSLRSLFVSSVLNLSEIYGFFWIQRREEERVRLSSCNIVAN